MSGIQMLILGGKGSSVETGFNAVSSWFFIPPGQGSGSSSIIFQSDGHIDATGTHQPTTLTEDDWYLPNTTGIGSSYWIRTTLTSGDAPNIDSGLNTWLALSTARSWGYSSGNSRSGTFLAEIASDSGGTNIVGSGTFSVVLEEVF